MPVNPFKNRSNREHEARHLQRHIASTAAREGWRFKKHPVTDSGARRFNESPPKIDTTIVIGPPSGMNRTFGVAVLVKKDTVEAHIYEEGDEGKPDLATVSFPSHAYDDQTFSLSVIGVLHAEAT